MFKRHGVEIYIITAWACMAMAAVTALRVCFQARQGQALELTAFTNVFILAGLAALFTVLSAVAYRVRERVRARIR